MDNSISLERSEQIAAILDAILKLEREKGGSGQTPFRPKFKQIFGSTNAAIFIERVRHWFEENHYEPFYKFFEPCSHELYREGDSWLEELGFSYEEASTVLKKIGTKITRGKSKNEAMKEGILLYWTDSNRVTWYFLNLINFAAKVHAAYQDNSLSKPGLAVYLDKLADMVHEDKPTTLDQRVTQSDRFTFLSESLQRDSIEEKDRKDAEAPSSNSAADAVDGDSSGSPDPEKNGASRHADNDDSPALSTGGGSGRRVIKSPQQVRREMGLDPQSTDLHYENEGVEQYSPLASYVLNRIQKAFKKVKTLNKAQREKLGSRVFWFNPDTKSREQVASPDTMFESGDEDYLEWVDFSIDEEILKAQRINERSKKGKTYTPKRDDVVGRLRNVAEYRAWKIERHQHDEVEDSTEHRGIPGSIYDF